jgi:predicted secreted hydrolase
VALGGVLAVADPAPARSGDAPAWRASDAPRAFVFPRDHAAHPEYATEWWYYTGHLRAGERRFGFQLTFFRIGVDPARGTSRSAWAAREFLFAHAALTDERQGRFVFDERIARPALGMAGADSVRYRVWIDDWSAALAADSLTHRLACGARGFGLWLDLEPRKLPVIHGEAGVSRKSAATGNASHYYSLTRLETDGRVVVDGETLAVRGESWMDHEFASNRMAGTHAGWDWFSVQLDDGRELMLYQLRLKDGGVEPLSHGTLVEPDGRTRPLALADFRVRALGRWRSPRTGGEYPSGWRLEVPGEGLSLTLTPTLRDQELVARAMGGIAYWEGSVRIEGERRGASVRGRGYVELTGYAGRAPF